MRITNNYNLKNQYKPNFNAVQIANARVNYQDIKTNYKILSIKQDDYKTIDKILKKIDIDKIANNIPEKDLSLWRSIILLTLAKPLINKVKTLLLIHDNKPCGALKYIDNPNTYYINGRTTWNSEKGEKLPFAGKVLTLTLFNLLLKENKNDIRSLVIRESCFNTMFKALELGFKSFGGDNFMEDMRISQAQVKDSINKYKEIIEIDLTNSEDNVNLEKLIEL